MKKYLFILLLIYTSQLFSQNGNDWNFVHHLPQNTLYSVKPIPETSKIIAVGDAGTIMISPDMGATWNVQYIKQFQYLSINSIFFTDSVNGYIGGGTGFVYKTTDGGNTWNEEHTGTTAWVKTIYFPSLNVGYVACSNGIIVKTIDGGLNWSTLVFPSIYDVNDVYFKNDSVGFVTVDRGGIYYTTDGGNSWVQQVALTTTQRLGSFQILNDTTIYAVGYDSLAFLYKTFDGGNTWNRTQASALQWLYKICFTSLDTGLAIAASTSLYFKTTDGGQNWSQDWIFHTNTQRPNSIGFLNSNTIISGFINGIILKTNDVGNTFVPLTDTMRRAQYKDCHFFNDSSGLTLSKFLGNVWDTCYIMRTTNGCSTMDTVKKFYGTIGSGLEAFSFLNDSVGFVLMGLATYPSTHFMLAKTTDGGLHWNSINHNLINFYPDEILFVNDTVGYLLSHNNIAKTIDGGLHWTVTAYPTYSNPTLSAIYFINDTLGFVSGQTSVGVSPGFIGKTIDGGISWTSTIVGSADLLKILFVNDSIGFACDDYGGHIYKTIDQGQNWVLVASTGIGFWNMFFPSDSVGYCIGGAGRIVKTTDQGQTWGVQYSKSDMVLRTGSFINDSTGYIVGGLNSLIHIKGDSYVCPEATFSPSTLNANAGDTINLGFYFYYWQLNSQTTYIWNFGDGTYDSVPYTTHAYTSGGDYTVTFTVHYRDCVNSSSCIIHINSTVGLPNYSENGILIYPNPFTLQTTISFEKEQKNTTVLISDVLGREIKSMKFTGTQMTIDKAEMKAGIYFVQTTDEQKRICNRKIIIQ